MLITWQFFQSYYSFVNWYGAHRCILMIQWTTQMSNCQCSLKFLKRGHNLDMQPMDFDIRNVTFCCTFLTYWVAGSLVSACIYHSSRPSQLDVVGALAADCLDCWHLPLQMLHQSSGQLPVISLMLAMWHWAYLVTAMLKLAKSLIAMK